HRGQYGAKFTATVLSGIRRRGWAQSVAERDAGVASVSAPERGPSGKVIAAVSISGPVERMTRMPGRLHGDAVAAAGHRLTEVLRSASEDGPGAPWWATLALGPGRRPAAPAFGLRRRHANARSCRERLGASGAQVVNLYALEQGTDGVGD